MRHTGIRHWPVGQVSQMSPRAPKPEPKPKSVVKRAKTVPPANNGKHPGGRPSKYTPELVAQICKDLEVGNMRRAVAAANGIDKDTITDWMHVHPEFSAQVRRSEAIPEYRCVIKIMLGNPGWQAAAWWLERKWHMDWGKRERIDMVVDTRSAAEKAAADAGLPTDKDSIDRLVALAETYAMSSRVETKTEE